MIKPREELAWPLLPHEGVARAIALFNFDAVEDGDLSLKKGDIIVITKKSDSTDDWYVPRPPVVKVTNMYATLGGLERLAAGKEYSLPTS